MHIKTKWLFPLTVILVVALLSACKISTADGVEEEPTEKVVFTTVESSTVEPTTEHETVSEKPLYVITQEIPLDLELQVIMQQACDKYNVPYALALAVAECESDFDLEADSGTCWGLMQIHPINYEWLREKGIEPTTYEGNIEAGVFMLGDLLEEYVDKHKALMAYNCGETGAKRLWDEGYTESKYSVKVINASEHWQEIINK